MTKQKDDRKRKASKGGLAGLLVALAMLLGWCGRGLFGGGEGKPGNESSEEETAQHVQALFDAAPAPCTIRVDAAGIQVDGAPVDIAAAIAACKPGGEAELTITGDANFGIADELHTALDAAGIRVSLQTKSLHATPK